MTNRYDSDEYLTAWRDRGVFPEIHADLWQLVNEETCGTSYVDLCCSIGLLGTHVIQSLKSPCIGIEGHGPSVEKAARFGVPLPIHQITVDRTSLDRLEALLKENRVDVLLARRCLSEIFAGAGNGALVADEEFARLFTAMLARCGVKQVFHQGRQVTRAAKHPVPDVQAEARLMTLSGHYRIVQQRGECGHLEFVT